MRSRISEALLVDDRISNVDELKRFLWARRIHLDVATTILTASRMITAQNYALLISRAHLQDGDAHELLRHMQAPPCATVVVGSNGMLDQTQKLLESGFSACLTEPIDWGELGGHPR